jgi:Zn-dependent protease with chaperone function
VLGLVPGTRRLYVGVPLLMGLTTQQLRSVLAYELGHYSGRHTALAGVSYRGKESIGRVLGELEADVLSAELVGPAIATSALEELPPLDAAWAHFLDQYVALGDEVGSRPADLFDGFRRFLADPVRQEQLADVRTNPGEPQRSVYDTTPPSPSGSTPSPPWTGPANPTRRAPPSS